MITILGERIGSGLEEAGWDTEEYRCVGKVNGGDAG